MYFCNTKAFVEIILRHNVRLECSLLKMINRALLNHYSTVTSSFAKEFPLLFASTKECIFMYLKVTTLKLVFTAFNVDT